MNRGHAVGVLLTRQSQETDANLISLRALLYESQYRGILGLAKFRKTVAHELDHFTLVTPVLLDGFRDKGEPARAVLGNEFSSTVDLHPNVSGSLQGLLDQHQRR